MPADSNKRKGRAAKEEEMQPFDQCPEGPGYYTLDGEDHRAFFPGIGCLPANSSAAQEHPPFVMVWPLAKSAVRANP